MTRIVFMGTPRFGQLILQALLDNGEIAGVVTQPDRLAGRGRELSISPVKELALAHGLSLLQPEKLREPGMIERLQQLAPDVIVVAAFGQILPRSVLSIPQHGCLNVHASLLPRYRGAAPIPAAILAGDHETGITIMLMDPGLDTGPILSQVATAIAPDDTTASLTEKLGQTGAHLLLDTLPCWMASEIAPQPQDENRATWTRPLATQDARIDWQQSAAQIARLCRAMYPWPVAYTLWEGVKLQVLQAHPLAETHGSVAPGRVVAVGSGVAVGTGDGWLLLRQVQLAGKRAMPVDAFVRGQRTFVGSILA